MTATTTNNATTTGACDLNAVLSNAISALAHFDAAKLEEMEGNVSALLASNNLHALFPPDDAERQANLEQIIANHRLLGTLLASTSLNLTVLERLHSRNSIGEVSWAR